MALRAIVWTTVSSAALAFASGCGGGPGSSDEFFTSGDREADQRAAQRMEQAEQVADTEGPAAEGAPKGPGGAAIAPAQLTLYQRLGGSEGIQRIVDDFVDRAMADPRVNWKRAGVTEGGVMGVGGSSAEWQATPDKVSRLKQHLAQFLALTTGGPTEYSGRAIKEVHTGMKITNAEFDASVGDLKATLDRLQVPDQEQKELLAVIESTRPQIVEQR